MGFLARCWSWIAWLISLARPENLQELGKFGPWWLSYLVLSAIVFAETGLLVGFFLPGDSLLFAAGFLASQNAFGFDIGLLNACLMVAAILGDAVNYHLGRQAGEHVFDKGRLRFVKHDHLMAAKAFYDRHGGKAIVLARFIPIVRTFTPFVAGVARMGYRRFVVYNCLGGAGWVASMTLAGYWLGNIPWVKEHFELVVLGIIFVSVLPLITGAWRRWRGGRQPAAKVNPVEHPDVDSMASVAIGPGAGGPGQKR